MENKISTSELRLGNLVYDGNYTKFPMQVETISKDYVYLDFEGNEGDVYECSNEEIKPIPITNELLKNLNMVIVLPAEPPYFINYIKFERVQNDNAIIPSTLISEYETGSPAIKYVHQLQNMVFALSGEELEIKREWL